MKLAENMDGIVIAAIAAIMMTGVLAFIAPSSNSGDIATSIDSEIHTVTITAKRI